MIFSIFFSTVGGVIAAVNGYTFLNPDTMLTAGVRQAVQHNERLDSNLNPEK